MQTMRLFFILLLSAPAFMVQAQQSANTDFDAYEKLVAEAKEHRKTRQVTLEEFIAMSKEPKTIILDARSDKSYEKKHIKGAIHLDFTDFTEGNLAQTLGLYKQAGFRILIYCNNNFNNDRDNFPRKEAYSDKVYREKDYPATSLALNISTYIHLYGYGYRNVYELSQCLSVDDERLVFEGTDVKKVKEEPEQKAVQQRTQH